MRRTAARYAKLTTKAMDERECLVNNDAVQRLREPGAWVLLGSAALQFLGGLIGLFSGSDVPFTFRAFNLVSGDQFFAGVAVVGVVVIAVLLATRWGGGPTPQARNIAVIGAVLLAAIAVIEVLCVFVGLAAGSGHDGIVLDVSFSSKIAMFLYGIAKLAVLAVAGYYVFTIFQSLGPVRAGTGPFPQQGYGQPQPPYGYAQAPYGQPVAGQPVAGQPGQPGQRGPEGPQAYLPYGQPPQRAPEGSPYPPQGHYQQPPPPAQPYQQAQPSDGEWTVAYGAGEQRTEHDAPKGEGPSDPYRPPQ
jgi:hypothetical protein